MKVKGVYCFNGVKTEVKQLGKELMLFKYNYDEDKLGQVVAKKTVNRHFVYDSDKRVGYNKEIFKQNYI